MRRILVVCLGNICRSPTGAAVLRHVLREAGCTDIHVESAGTASYHEGDPADPRTIRHAHRRGLDLSSHRARGVRDSDVTTFDMFLCMDAKNLATLRERFPAEHHSRFVLYLGDRDVPDPYCGGPDGFERVLDLCEQGARHSYAQWMLDSAS